ncbi:MAG: flagellin [Planctomycetes bacterium]|nr:flagellin [Planctomycetota bacterium]
MSLNIQSNYLLDVARQAFGKNSALRDRSLERMSTGLRINRASDDVGGMVMHEKFRTRIASLQTSISNVLSSVSLVQIAESALAEMDDLLNQLRGVFVESQNLPSSSSQKGAAAQRRIDDILDAIDRISSTTRGFGKNILDGTLGREITFVGDLSVIGGTKIDIPEGSRLSLGEHKLISSQVAIVSDINNDGIAIYNQNMLGEGGRLTDASDAGGLPFLSPIFNSATKTVYFAGSDGTLQSRHERDTGNSVTLTNPAKTGIMGGDDPTLVTDIHALSNTQLVYANDVAGESYLFTQSAGAAATQINFPRLYNPTGTSSAVVAEYDAGGLFNSSFAYPGGVSSLTSVTTDGTLLYGIRQDGLIVSFDTAGGSAQTFAYQDDTGTGLTLPLDAKAIAYVPAGAPGVAANSLFVYDPTQGFARVELNTGTSTAHIMDVSSFLEDSPPFTVTESGDATPDSFTLSSGPDIVDLNAFTTTGTITVTATDVNTNGSIDWVTSGPADYSGQNILTASGGGVIDIKSNSVGTVAITQTILESQTGGFLQGASGAITDTTGWANHYMTATIDKEGASPLTANVVIADGAGATGADIATSLQNAIDPGMARALVTFDGGTNSYKITSLATGATSEITLTDGSQDAVVSSGATVPGSDRLVTHGQLRVTINGAATDVTISNTSIPSALTAINTQLGSSIFAFSALKVVGTKTAASSAEDVVPEVTVQSLGVTAGETVSIAGASSTDISALTSGATFKVAMTNAGVATFQSITLDHVSFDLSNSAGIAAAMESAIENKFSGLSTTDFAVTFDGSSYKFATTPQAGVFTSGGVEIRFEEDGSSTAFQLGLTSTAASGDRTNFSQVTRGAGDLFVNWQFGGAGASKTGTGKHGLTSDLKLTGAGVTSDSGGIAVGDKFTVKIALIPRDFTDMTFNGTNLVASSPTATVGRLYSTSTLQPTGGTINFANAVQTGTEAVAYDGTNYYVESPGTPFIYALDSAGTIKNVILKPESADVNDELGMAFSGGLLYVTNDSTSEVYAIDPFSAQGQKVIVEGNSTFSTLKLKSSNTGTDQAYAPVVNSAGTYIFYELYDGASRSLIAHQRSTGLEHVVLTDNSPFTPATAAPTIGTAAESHFQTRSNASGSRIVLVEEGNVKVYDVDVAGGTTTLVSDLGAGDNPEIDSSGTYVVFERPDTNPTDLFFASADGSFAPVNFTASENPDSGPESGGVRDGNEVTGGSSASFSTGGDRIAFISNGDVYVYRTTNPLTGQVATPIPIKPSDVDLDAELDNLARPTGPNPNSLFTKTPTIDTFNTMTRETFTIKILTDPDEEYAGTFSVNGDESGSHADGVIGKEYVTSGGVGGTGMGLRFTVNDDGQYTVGDEFLIDVDVVAAIRLDGGPTQLATADRTLLFEDEYGQRVAVSFASYIPSGNNEVRFRVEGEEQFQTHIESGLPGGQEDIVIDSYSSKSLGLDGMKVTDSIQSAWTNLTVSSQNAGTSDELEIFLAPEVRRDDFVPRKETYRLTFKDENTFDVTGTISGTIAKNLQYYEGHKIEFRGIELTLTGKAEAGDYVTFGYDGELGTLAKIDLAKDRIADARAELGAKAFSLENWANTQTQQRFNFVKSDSDIGDADMAAEFTNYTRNQLLAGQFHLTSTLSQISSERMMELLGPSLLL